MNPTPSTPSTQSVPLLTEGQTSILQVFGEPRFHADGDLVSLAYDSDGAIWSVEEPGLLRRWDPVTGRPVVNHYLSDLETLWVFGPNATRLASASDELTLWDVVTGQIVATLPQESWVTALAFRCDGEMLATGHDDGMVRIWDLRGYRLVREYSGHELPVSALAFSPDGGRLASAGEDRLVRCWDAIGGRALVTMEGHTDRVPALAWHPLGQFLVSAGWDTTARVWDTTTGEPYILLNSHADQVHTHAFSPDGRFLACADSANTVHLWHTGAWTTLHLLDDCMDEVRCLAYSPDGRYLASGGAERVIHVWETQRGRLISGHTSPSQHSIGTATTSAGVRLASTTGGTVLRIWDTTTTQPVPPREVEGMLSLAYSPDGRFVAGGGADRRIHLWDAATGDPFLTLMGQRGPVASMAFSPDCKLLASASASDGTVWLYNLTTGEPALLIIEASDGCTIDTLSFHPQGHLLACGGIDWMATGGSDGAVCVWNIVTKEKVVTFTHGTQNVAFHPSGRWLAAASLEDVVLVWDMETQQLIGELGGHTEGVAGIAYSPDGRWLASIGEDQIVRLWDAAQREQRAALELDTNLKAVCFSPDSKYLFTGNGNTTCFQLEVARMLEGEGT
jgi:WD40 repeat protein